MSTAAATKDVGVVGWFVMAAALGVALVFSTGMALAFELALDATLLRG